MDPIKGRNIQLEQQRIDDETADGERAYYDFVMHDEISDFE